MSADRQRAAQRGDLTAGLQLAGYPVHHADELGHERGGRVGVQLVRRGDLLEPALPHDADPVRHRQRFLLVVGDEQGGGAEPLLQRADLLAQLRQRGTCRAVPPAAGARSPAADLAHPAEARRPRCRARTCSGTGCSSGTPCPCPAGRPAPTRCPCRRPGPTRCRPSRSRPRCAARSSCRSRTARASATSSPGAISMDSPSRARVAPKARVRSRSSTLVPPPALGLPDGVGRGGGVPGGVGGHQSPRVSVTCDGEQGDLAAAGLARLPGPEDRDGQQEDPGDEQREQRGRDRDLAAGLAVDVDPHREGLVQVQAGDGELAEDQRHGEHGRRQQRGPQVGQDHPPQRAAPSPRPANWTPRRSSSGRARAARRRWRGRRTASPAPRIPARAARTCP